MKLSKVSKTILSLSLAVSTLLSVNVISAHANGGGVKPSECTKSIYIPVKHEFNLKVGDTGSSRFYCGSPQGDQVEFSSEDIGIGVDEPSVVNNLRVKDNVLYFDAVGEGFAEVTIYWKTKKEGTRYTFLLMNVTK
ncbi:hypothetical protein [Paenibacillus ehimensis]|uniref:Uncharacterized protein n=1 Tax=Paenibacillus ehimensis TaxID=79264 RepID=A0ABT8VIR3_9BACL|nr:hypothetical protein [Paenibacillus ehimensis]MDO3680879.1 hypothetical protein [Paenibacillus ehimensis]